MIFEKRMLVVKILLKQLENCYYDKFGNYFYDLSVWRRWVKIVKEKDDKLKKMEEDLIQERQIHEQTKSELLQEKEKYNRLVIEKQGEEITNQIQVSPK